MLKKYITKQAFNSYRKEQEIQLDEKDAKRFEAYIKPATNKSLLLEEAEEKAEKKVIKTGKK